MRCEGVSLNGGVAKGKKVVFVHAITEGALPCGFICE